MIVFFDEVHAESVGINSYKIKVLFFTLLSVSTVAALQTVGAFLVIALVVTPGATAYLLTNKFSKLIIISVIIGSLTSFFGAYLSYFLDGATGGVIVLLLTILFLIVFLLSSCASNPAEYIAGIFDANAPKVNTNQDQSDEDIKIGPLYLFKGKMFEILVGCFSVN